jgi:hypothetical protein
MYDGVALPAMTAITGSATSPAIFAAVSTTFTMLPLRTPT